MVDAFSVTSSALPSTTRVLAFRGTEALSALYEFQVHLWIEDTAFDMAPALGANVTLLINRQDEQPCAFHGILATLETVDDVARGAVYRAVLVPRLWQLTLTQHSRVFVGQTAPAILEEILRGGGMTSADYTLMLTGTYGPLDHVCQYRESSFAFLSRRMEREGIYYFFEQGESRERLIITDDKSVHKPLSTDPVRYHRVSGAGAGGVEGLRSFTCKHSTIPGSVVVKDHDYLRPSLDVSSVAPASDRAEEVHLYGENFVTPEEARRLARIRAEEWKARQVVFRGVGNTSLLRSGYSFALEDHPRPSVDGEYLTTSLLHTGHHYGGLAGAKEMLGLEAEPDEVYRVEVVAIPRGAQFRPERRTPVPRIYGTERAVVDGPTDSDYAQLDEHGRYLVKMHIDESPVRSGKASARIRMMQPHGGSPESFHFPLRKGTEVLLTFEGGDPDRPVIAGVVPNLHNPTLVTAKNATKNILQTGAGNRLVIEDEKGKEYIHLSTPHKRTFMHMGSTFNPQYNAIKNTDGTSLSYTTQLSTTFVGDDNETIVDRARVTLIGRGMMQSTDVTGKEVAVLLGAPFITALEGEEAPDDAETAALNTAVSDQGTAAGLAAPASADWAALPNPPPLTTDPTYPAFLAALNAAVTATQNADGSIHTTQTAVNAWVTSDPGGANSLAAQTLANTAVTSSTAAVTAAGTAQATPTAANLTAAAKAAAAASTAIAAVKAKLAFDSASLPDSPSSNVTGTFINIRRGPSGTDPVPADPVPGPTTPTTPNTPINLPGSDFTAMDVLQIEGTLAARRTDQALNAGSDIKIVGGDNVNLVAFDSRSHTIGTSYGLVLGGQASVVRNGQQSKVMAPAKSTAAAVPSLTTPTTFTPLAFPLSPVDATSTTAQSAEIYGDKFSWVNGNVNGTVTGVQTTTIKQGSHTEIFAPTLTTVTTAPVHTEAGTAQSTALHGNQFSWIDGSVNAMVTGSKTTLIQQGTTSEVYAPSRNPNALPDPAPPNVTSPAPTTAQATALHGDQYSWIDGDVNATITGNKTTQVHNSTTHAALLESHSDTSYKTTAIASLDLTTMKFALAALSMAVTGVSVSASVFKVDVGIFKVDTKGFHLLV